MRLSDKIRECTKCIDLGLTSPDKLKIHQKPYVRFKVEEKWKPSKIDVLFVAESPPCNGEQRYFYNLGVEEKKNDLRNEVKSRLDLDRLEDFKKKGYFLIDTIECRVCKPIKKKVLYKIAVTCSRRFLLKEIGHLRPNTIFVFGSTAKHALQQTTDFAELTLHKITHDYDARLSNYRVILCPFPGGLTRKWTREINRAFTKI